VDPCPHCDGSGFLVDEETRRAYPCECRPRRIARKRAAALAGRLPKAFRGVSFDREPLPSMRRDFPDVVRAVRRYTDSISEQLLEGRGMWFTGDLGTGKTTLAMLISKSAIEADHTVAIYSLPRLLAMLRETFRGDSALSLNDLIDRLCSVDLLHIDDVGAEQTSEWVLEQLYTVVNTRYEDRRSMVLTTNLIDQGARPRPADLAADAPFDDRFDARLREQIGDRTVSRLYEMCGTPLPMFGHDRRLDLGGDLQLPPPIDDAEYARSSDPDEFDDLAWEEVQRPYGRPLN
jgi:DNA replication protein DnaC